MQKDERNATSKFSIGRIAKLLNCGFVSGLLQAFIFNPWDRALYLSVKNERAFLRWDNFHDPFGGVMQTVVQRALSAGLYFPMEELSYELITYSGFNNPFVSLAAGTLAGIINGVVMNPFSRIKYHYWGKVDSGKENFLSTAQEILKTGGVRQLFVGTTATVQRDLLFGATFAFLRREAIPRIIHGEDRFDDPPPKNSATVDLFINLLSGMAATIVSSPINYVRNIHYATPPSEAPKTAIRILKDLVTEATLREQSALGRCHFIQSRLRIGWGTARVGCGMAVGAKLYDMCSKVMAQRQREVDESTSKQATSKVGVKIISAKR